MKPIACALVALAALVARPARATEAAASLESDHLDAFDDASRHAAVLVNPAGALLGVYGLEADLVLGSAAAVSAEGDLYLLGGTTAYGLTLGVPIYPQRVVLHGFYVHPRAGVARAMTEGSGVEVFGAGATLGWAWTMRVGLTVRVGGGVMVEHTVAGIGENLDGLVPVADGMVGWAF